MILLNDGLPVPLAGWVTKLKSYLPLQEHPEEVGHTSKCILVGLINQSHRRMGSLLILEGMNTSTVVVKTSSPVVLVRNYRSGRFFES